MSRGSRSAAVLLLAAVALTGCGSEPGAPTAASPTSAGPTTGNAEPVAAGTERPRQGLIIRAASQLEDPDGYQFLVSIDLTIRSAALDTTNSKPGFARVFYDTTASVAYKNVTGGGRTASLNSSRQILRLLWDPAKLSGPAAAYCAPKAALIAQHNYCAIGDINFRPNTNSDADFRRKIPDGDSSAYRYPSKYREPERAASPSIPEDAARAIVELFNTGTGPDQVALVTDQHRLNRACLIGKDIDVAALSNSSYMFMVDRASVVTDSLC